MVIIMGRDCRTELDCSAPTQAIRIIDVFALGPAMIWMGRRQGGMVGVFVATAGVLTIGFNGARLLEARRRRREVRS